MRDEVFKSNLVCAFIVLIFITSIQSLLPSASSVTMAVQFSALIVLHCCLLLVTTAEDYKCLPLVLRTACCWVNETASARTAIVCLSILINFLAAMINILWCDFDKPNAPRNQTYDMSGVVLDVCFYPEYSIFTGVLAMVTCAVFLRLNSVLKLSILLLMMGVYSVLTEAFYTSLFLRYDRHHNTQNFLGTKETSLLLMAMFLLAVFYHGQQLEYTARLDFLWRVQAKEEINEMKELREHNENMLRNILPSHVARHFLEKDRDNEELYSQSYDAVGVMFASIPGFADFYSQTEMNNQGVECLRLLNEIIADFDELLGRRWEEVQEETECVVLQLLGQEVGGGGGRRCRRRLSVLCCSSWGRRWEEVQEETECVVLQLLGRRWEEVQEETECVVLQLLGQEVGGGAGGN
uniref:adenylate cyclase n=1 Tax=Knipowitschia caucasica TaxID=637954 RepID=A0AAV2JUG3_KNICA